MFKRHTATGAHDREAASADSALTCSDPSKAVQSQKEDADINVIVKRFGVTGKLPVAVNLPEYGDFTDAPRDYREARERVAEAEKAFMTIPAEIREKFNHDPVEFFEQVTKASKEQLEEWGLVAAQQDTQVALSDKAAEALGAAKSE